MQVKHLFLSLTVICTLLLLSSVRAQQNEPQVMNIPDPNLAAAIRNATGEDTITTHTMLALRNLSASHYEIEDLTGLEYAHNLRSLLLPDNNISDLSPLAELKNLVSLDLQNNNISDASPLVGLINLKPHGGFYSALNIQLNPLNYASINTHIPAMQAKGIDVVFSERVPERKHF